MFGGFFGFLFVCLFGFWGFFGIFCCLLDLLLFCFCCFGLQRVSFFFWLVGWFGVSDCFVCFLFAFFSVVVVCWF